MRKLLALIPMIILCSCRGNRLTPAEAEAVIYLRERAKVPGEFEILNVESHEVTDREKPVYDTTFFFRGKQVFGYDIKTDRYNNLYKHYPKFLDYDSISVKVTRYDDVKYTSVDIDYTGKTLMGTERRGSESVIICECGVRGDMLDFVYHRRAMHGNDTIIGRRLEKPVRMKNPHPSGDFTF